jgi:hypothetical protein
MIPHLLCYKGLAVEDYGFALDAADMGNHSQRQASLDFRSIEISIYFHIGNMLI